MSEVADTLASLIRIDSVNPEWGGPGEGEVARFVEAFFGSSGIETEEDEVLPGRANVMARIPGRDRDRSVLLEVHMDTVSTGDMTIAPYEPEIRGGRMYGRGACDDKGGLAAMMHAVREIHRSGTRPPVDVRFAAVVDEEHRHRGVDRLVERLRAEGRPLPEAALVAEPTGLRLARANKGVLRFTVETRGKAAHSSKPHLGRNAIADMAGVVAAFQEAESSLADSVHPLVGPPTCSIGLIEGGTQINFVPEHCRITVDRRLVPGEAAAAVLAGYEELLEALRSASPGLEVRIGEGGRLVDEAMETPADAEAVRCAVEVLGDLDLDSEPVGVPFGCDCTKLSRAGIPSMIFGPGSIDQAHGAVEFVEIEQVQRAAEFVRKFLLRFGS